MFVLMIETADRNAGHFKVYKKRCLERSITMHDRAIPDAEPESKMKQSTLDSAITREARIPAFSNRGMLDYIIELVVSEDKVWPCYFSHRALADLCRQSS
jgi:hypothetical protein